MEGPKGLCGGSGVGNGGNKVDFLSPASKRVAFWRCFRYIRPMKVLESFLKIAV